MKILITGATGFIGRELCQKLINDGHKLIVAVRSFDRRLSSLICQANIGDIGPDTDWSRTIEGIDVVIHAAARVHVMKDKSMDHYAEFMRINAEGSIALALAAAKSGVRRFIFLSSVKVNGETTIFGRPFTSEDIAAPRDAYGISKFVAEQGIREIARCARMNWVIIRPTMVYGPGVKGNFLTLMQLIQRRVPLPIANIDNRRSMVGLENLVCFIRECVIHAGASNQVFLVSDGEDISIAELARRIGVSLDKRAILLPVPICILKKFGEFSGKGEVVKRLLSNLQVDIEKNRKLLGWHPSVSMATELERVAKNLISRIK